MFCYIKEWPNKMATLMTADGVVLCTCKNIDEARKVWSDWKSQQQSLANESSDSELEILFYSPTVTDKLKDAITGYYTRKEKNVVNA